MGDDDRVRRWEVATAWTAGALVLAALVVAIALAVPPSLANLASERSDGVTPVTLEADGRSAAIVVPVDWIVTREAADAVRVRTPDGVLDAHLELVDAAPTAALDPPADAGVSRHEVLASGANAVHADLPAGLVGAVAGAGAAPSVRIIVEIVPPASPSDYRPAMAELLEGVRA